MSKHTIISYVKSGIRILGYVTLGVAAPVPMVLIAVGILVVSEIMGIVEEVGL